MRPQEGLDKRSVRKRTREENVISAQPNVANIGPGGGAIRSSSVPLGVGTSLYTCQNGFIVIAHMRLNKSGFAFSSTTLLNSHDVHMDVRLIRNRIRMMLFAQAVV